MSNGNLSVFVGKDYACVKISGRANFACSPDFKTLLSELTQKGFTHFIIDLSQCVLMDSTFLGVLASFGMKLTPKDSNSGGGIELLNSTARVTELLENLGAVHLFKMTSGPLEPSKDLKSTQHESIKPTHEQIARTSLEAHQTLMAINPENVARFKDVAQFLAEDLKNLEKNQ